MTPTPKGSPVLLPDRAQLERYFDALFKHADPSSYLSLRIFGGAGNKLLREEAVLVGAPDRSARVEAMARIAAEMEVASPAFAPPACTFANPHRARVVDLLEGVTIVCELDERPRASLAVLVSYLGVPTLVVQSGGRWTDPETGRKEPKLHVHWRLAAPARTADELQDLRTARRLACDLVGADASAVSIVHPLRAAGSVHRKAEPRVAWIEVDSDTDIALGDALARLRAIPPELFRRPPAMAVAPKPNADKTADSADVAAALAVIPNPDLPWDAWNEIGMAAWLATAGDWHAGFDAWEAWSEKSGKYEAGQAEERWHHYFCSPPTKIGAGTIFWHAQRAEPGWIKPSDRKTGESYFDAGIAAAAPPAEASTVPRVSDLDRFNDRYAVVLDGGRARVIRFDDEIVGDYRRKAVSFLTFKDFTNFHMNETIQVSPKEWLPIGDWWLGNPRRRQHEGLVFVPDGASVIDNRLNLWRGWGIEPAPGDWSLMRTHIHEVLASGDAAAERYIVFWLAWALQNPGRRAEAALVFKGRKGTGKGTVGTAFCRIFGQHALHLSSSNHLTGRFNGHLRDAAFVFADEAHWSGDKAAEGALKQLITEPTLMIEDKGIKACSTPNCLHVLMASNEAWVVPAGEDERRYAVFAVSDVHKQDKAWFGALYAQLDAGGYAAMLYDLLRLDIGDFHPRQVVHTAALVDQQRRGLSPEDAWWCELLETGAVWGASPERPDAAISNGEPDAVDRLVRRGIYDQARYVSPKLRGYSDHLLGQFLRGQGCNNARKVMQRRGWQFPDLQEARAAWERRFPDWSWRDTEVDAWRPEVDPGSAYPLSDSEAEPVKPLF